MKAILILSKKTIFKDLPDRPRPKRRGLTRLTHSPSESVAVIPQTGVSASADLAARFSSVLAGLNKRQVGAAALFETLKLETLDWGMDRGVETGLIDTTEQPVAAEHNDER